MKPRKRSHRVAIETLEGRRFLTVTANLVGGLLNIEGDQQDNAVTVRQGQAYNGTSTVTSGTTYMSTDSAALATAGLTVSSVNNTAPTIPDYSAAFAISNTTNFVYNGSTGAADSGTINHTGSISFNNNTITVGNFAIGYDATRATNGRSGYFVQNTLTGPGILFDLATPSATAINPNAFNLTGSLLVAPELATYLIANNVTTNNVSGLNVGTAKIAATATGNIVDSISIAGDGQTWRFDSSAVNSINAALFAGNDTLSTYGVTKPGTYNLGAGYDAATFINGSGTLDVGGGKNGDTISVIGGTYSDLAIRGARGNDTIQLINTSVTSVLNVNGGPGTNTLFTTGDTLPTNSTIANIQVYIPSNPLLA